LRLARTLLQRVKENSAHPLPVVFNLSSWTQRQQTLANWFTEELNSRYQVPNKIGQRWVESRQVLPLLDGLDEMDELACNACVQAIVSYQQEKPEFTGTPLVICCRNLEYTLLSTHLPLNRAVRILPLTQEQVEQYLQ
jgi:predicted NACHT family NTPase